MCSVPFYNFSASRVAMVPLPDDVLDNAGKLVVHAFHHANK